MKEAEQRDRFCAELDKLVDYYRSEYNISYASLLAALSYKHFELCIELKTRRLKDGDDNGDGDEDGP